MNIKKEEIRVLVPAEVKAGLKSMGNGSGSADVITALYFNAIQTGFSPFGVKISTDNINEKTVFDKESK